MPSKHITSKPTYIFDSSFETPKLRIAKGVKLHVTLLRKRGTDIYGKTPGGYALLRNHRGEVFIEPKKTNQCNICFEEAGDNFKGVHADFGKCQEMPCCKRHIHVDCVKAMVLAGHSGKAIGFNHVKCPYCRESMLEHRAKWPPDVFQVLNQENQIYERVKELEKIQDKGLPPEEQGGWAFYMCNECHEPFCGGKVSCAEEFDLDPSAMICDGCLWSKEADDHRCFEHGRDYAIFKCDFCCSPASYGCGNHYYCVFCHDHGGYQNPKACPGGDKCPLGIPHPRPVSKPEIGRYCLSFVIGCQKCNNPDMQCGNAPTWNKNPFEIDKQQHGNLVIKFEYSKYDWNSNDLKGGHLFDLESDTEDETEEYIDVGDVAQVNDVKDSSGGDEPPKEKLDNDILLHAPIFPPPMVAQSS